MKFYKVKFCLIYIYIYIYIIKRKRFAILSPIISHFISLFNAGDENIY